MSDDGFCFVFHKTHRQDNYYCILILIFLNDCGIINIIVWRWFLWKPKQLLVKYIISSRILYSINLYWQSFSVIFFIISNLWFTAKAKHKKQWKDENKLSNNIGNLTESGHFHFRDVSVYSKTSDGRQKKTDHPHRWIKEEPDVWFYCVCYPSRDRINVFFPHHFVTKPY